MTTVAGLEASLSLETAAFVSGAEHARRAMQQTMGNIERDVSKTQLALGGLTAGLAGFARGLGQAAVGYASFQTLSKVIGTAITEFSQAENAQVKFQAVLRATGNEAGITAGRMTEFAEQMEQTRNVTAATVTEAGARLATFEDITGSTFTRAIEVAQDLSVVLGEDLVSATARVGKALQDPVEGLTSLERAGIKLSSEQRLLIDQFLEMGQTAEAQGVILDELANRVGGAGAAEANTLTGAFSAATTAAGNFLAALLDASGGANALQTMSRAAAAGLNELTASMKGQAQAISLGESQLKLKQELIEAEERLAQIQENAAGISSALVESAVEQQQGIINNLRTSIQDIETEITRAADFARQSELDIKQFQAQQVIEPPKVDTGLHHRLQQFVTSIKGADRDRVASTENAIRDITRLEEQRHQDFLDMLQEEVATEARARGNRGQVAQSRTQGMNTLRLEAERASMEALDKLPPKTEEVANAQYDILIRPWQDLAGDINRIMSGVFEQILFDARSMDFSSIAKGIGDTFARAISGSLANIIMTPITKTFTKLATEGVGIILAEMRSQTATGYTAAAGLGGAGGFVLGSAYSQIAGLKPGNQAALGGGLGGAGGAALGLYLTGGNPLGALAGGALGSIGGSLLGGLFGGQRNLGNDRSAQVFNLRRGLAYSDVSFSQENRQITQGIIDELSTLQEALEGIGANFQRFNLRIEAGTKTGITVNGKTYATAQDALRGSIEAMLGGTTGLTGIQAQILKTTKAGTAQSVMADVQFGQTYENLINKGTDLDRALAALNQTFGQAGRKAAELGLDVNALAEAHQREAAAVIQEFQARQQSFRAQLQTIAPAPGGELITAQFSALNQQFAELGRAAQQLGIPIEEVAAAHQRATANLTASIQQQQRDLVLQLRSTGMGGPDVVRAQFEQLNAQFGELAQSAIALSIPLEEVTAAHQRAAQQLTENIEIQQRQIAGQIALAGGDQSLGTQLFIIETNMRELVKTATAAGFSLEAAVNAVTRAHKAANEAAIHAVSQQWRNMSDALASIRGDTSVPTQLHALETRMRELGAEAARLGFPISEVTKAHQQAADNIIRANNELRRSFRAEVAGIAPTGSRLSIELRELDIRMDALRQRARDLGEGLGQVNAAAARAAAELRKQHAQEVQSFRQEMAAITPSGSSFEIELKALSIRFAEARQRAQELGISLNVVNQAQARATAELRAQQQRAKQSFRAELEQIAPTGGTDLTRALKEIDLRFAELRDRARELGVATKEVAAAQRRATEQARADFGRTQIALVNELEGIAAGGDRLTRDLRANTTAFYDMQQRAQALGVPLTLVSNAFVKLRGDIRKAFLIEQFQFRTELAGIAPTGSALEVALQELDSRFLSLRQKAEELAIPLAEVNAAQERAIKELEQRATMEKAAFIREIETMSPTGNLLARQLAEINDRFFDLRERAKELGVAVEILNAAQVRASDQARLQYELQRSALQRELGNISPTGDQLALILREVDDRFIDLRTRAIELDVALSQVDVAHARARDEAIKQFNERRAELLIQVENLGATGLTATLNDIRDQFRNLRKELDAVGLATVDLTLKQREAERRAVEAAETAVLSMERQAAEQQRGIRDFFESLMAPLRAANQNVLAPIAQIEAARRRFAETAALAREGDLEALRDLASVTQELMGLRERFLSSGGLGAEILAQVQAGTQGIVAGLEQQQREAMASVPDVIRETTSEHIRVLIAENAKTLEELQALRRELAQNRLRAA